MVCVRVVGGPCPVFGLVSSHGASREEGSRISGSPGFTGMADGRLQMENRSKLHLKSDATTNRDGDDTFVPLGPERGSVSLESPMRYYVRNPSLRNRVVPRSWEF